MVFDQLALPTERNRSSIAWMVLLLVLLHGGACHSPAPLAPTATSDERPPDRNAEPSGAVPIALGESIDDSLHCDGGDCADWFLVQCDETGTLVVEATVASGEPGSELQVLISDGSYVRIVGRASAAEALVGPKENVRPGPYFIVARPSGEQGARFRYQLRASFQRSQLAPVVQPEAPAKPPPVASSKTANIVVSEILEREPGDSTGDFLLIEVGSNAGIEPGMRGRVHEEDRTIATVEVTDVFPEGSRVKINGVPSAPIDFGAVVEIDVPTE